MKNKYFPWIMFYILLTGISIFVLRLFSIFIVTIGFLSIPYSIIITFILYRFVKNYLASPDFRKLNILIILLFLSYIYIALPRYHKENIFSPVAVFSFLTVCFLTLIVLFYQTKHISFKRTIIERSGKFMDDELVKKIFDNGIDLENTSVKVSSSILFSECVYANTESKFLFKKTGNVKIKGLPENFPVYELKWV